MTAEAYRELGNFTVAEEYLKDAYTKIAVKHGESNIASTILNSMGMLYKS